MGRQVTPAAQVLTSLISGFYGACTSGMAYTTSLVLDVPSAASGTAKLSFLRPPNQHHRNSSNSRRTKNPLSFFIRYFRVLLEAILPLGVRLRILAARLFAFQKLPYLVEFTRSHTLGGVFTHKAIEHTAVGGIGKAQSLLINMYGSECSPTTVCLGRIHLVPFVTAWDLRKAPSWPGFGAFLIGSTIPYLYNPFKYYTIVI